MNCPAGSSSEVALCAGDRRSGRACFCSMNRSRTSTRQLRVQIAQRNRPAATGIGDHDDLRDARPEEAMAISDVSPSWTAA